jgi:hypothetical protein
MAFKKDVQSVDSSIQRRMEFSEGNNVTNV